MPLLKQSKKRFYLKLTKILSLSTTAIISKVFDPLPPEPEMLPFTCLPTMDTRKSYHQYLDGYDNHDLVDCGFYVVIQTVDKYHLDEELTFRVPT